jgi:AhpD family alkylhydroperoxidase
MKAFTVPTRAELTPEAQTLYDGILKAFGFVPNLFATIGYSANALGSYLGFQGAQAKGTFNGKEREAIYLAVSQVNECQYCQAAHTAIGKNMGLTDADMLQVRGGTHADQKLSTITKLAADIQRTHGRPDAKLLEAFFALGYKEAALIDLLALVSDKVFANYVHNITQIPIDFPVAQPLEAVAN